MKKDELTEEERKRLLKELEAETTEDIEWKERIERFEKLQIRRLRVPEWRLLLVLAYKGPQSMYAIKKTYNLQYATIHRATKSLEKTGWVKVVDTRHSEKNVLTKIYNVTPEGLLWLMSKIPKTIHPSLIDFSECDSLSLRKTLEEKDTAKVANLGTQNDVYLHLLLDFNVNRIAKSNMKLFPLVFGNWDFYIKIGVAQDIASEFPEAAFSTLVDYYHNYPLAIELGTLDMLFTYKCYYAFLELYARGYANIDTEFQNEIIEKAIKAFKSSPKLQELFQQISKEIEDRLAKRLEFIKHVKTKRI